VTLSLLGFGTALPEHSMTQDDTVDLHTTFCGVDPKRARTLRALYRRSRIERRHSSVFDASEGPIETRQRFYGRAEGEDDRGPTTAQRMEAYARHAPGLAVRAAGDALRAGGVTPAEVTHLVTVSCTGFVSPGVDGALMDDLGLDPATERTHVGFMGCHGALNGLRVARSYALQDPRAVPLVCAVELCSLHFSYGWDPDMLVANSLFADGAAAVVGRADAQGGSDASGGDAVGSGRNEGSAEERPWRVVATGTTLMADSAEAMSWRIGDHGFRMTLSARVPELIEENLAGWIGGWLHGHGLDVTGVGSWAVHPGGPRILTAVERALGLERSATQVSWDVLAQHGNMSSPTVLFIVDRLVRARAPRPCVALAFGPGLAVEATLLA
jgi:predicted naringenin-chalcone synthase